MQLKRSDAEWQSAFVPSASWWLEHVGRIEPARLPYICMFHPGMGCQVKAGLGSLRWDKGLLMTWVRPGRANAVPEEGWEAQ